MNSSPHGNISPLKRCGQLTAAVVGIWLVLAGPAWFVAGARGLEGLAYAALLCLVPGWLVFGFASRYADAGTQAAVVALGGTAVRLLFAFLGAVVLRDLRPELGVREFIVWLVAFYLATLLVETLLAVRMSASSGKRSRVGSV